jgi:hypothetical protein
MLPMLLIALFLLLFVLAPAFAAERRSDVKHVDVSAALPDDGHWLTR